MTKAYVDEKWIKIRKQWDYWVVVLDVDTGLPVYQTPWLPARRRR
jgi:hypothetical protein